MTQATTIESLRTVLTRRAVERSLLPEGADEAATDAAIEALLDREAPTPEPTDEECSRFYAKNLDRFTSGELVFARHILFAIVPGAPVDAIRSKAEETLARVRAEPESFAELARTLSNCPSGQHGGNLGQLSRGECVPSSSNRCSVYARRDFCRSWSARVSVSMSSTSSGASRGKRFRSKR